jgi:hypothetical protein
MNETLRFTSLGFQLNALLDRGEALDIGDTRKHISNRSLFGWLRESFGDELDLSLYRPDDEAEVLGLFESLSNAMNSRRKFGVEQNGLALLVAYCLEGLQQLHVT